MKAVWRSIISDVAFHPRSSQVLAVARDRAYIFGGELQARQPVPMALLEVDLDDGAHKTHPEPSSTTISPTPRVGAASTTLGDSILVFSGRGGLAMAPMEEQGALWQYKLSTSSWSQLSPQPATPFPAGRSYHCMTSDGQSTVFVHAGCPEKGRLSDLWSFEVEGEGGGVWRELESAPGPKRGGASVAFLGGKVYRMNGFDGEREQGGSLDVYDVEMGKWELKSYQPDGVDGPTPRSVGALLPVKVKGREYLVTLFGERDPSSLGHAGAGKMLDDVWAFDVVDGRWLKVETNSEGGAQPAARGWFAADVRRREGNEEIVMHGGLGEDNQRLGDCWVLSFST